MYRSLWLLSFMVSISRETSSSKSKSSKSSTSSTCETQEPCLSVTRQSLSNEQIVAICLSFDVFTNGCSSSSGKSYNYEKCEVVNCGSNALFSIEGGNGCAATNNLNDISISGIDGISCSPNRSKKKCTWSIPAGDCPTQNPSTAPTENETEAPTESTDDPTEMPTVNPTIATMQPSMNPTTNPTTFVKYTRTDTLYTWGGARDHCQLNGMQLATFDDGDDIQAIHDACNGEVCWVGFADFDFDTNYTFVDNVQDVVTKGQGYWRGMGALAEPSGRFPQDTCGIIFSSNSVEDSLAAGECGPGSRYGICETIEGASYSAQINDDEVDDKEMVQINDRNDNHDDDHIITIVIICGCILFGLLIIGAIIFGVYKSMISKGKVTFPRQQQQQQEQEEEEPQKQESTPNETNIELPAISPVTNIN